MMVYAPHGMGIYGGQSNYGHGYGDDYPQMYSQPSYQPEAQSSADDKLLARLLTASGVPNDDGKIRWPIGLSILDGPRPEVLRDQIGALFLVAAAQAASGAMNQNVVDQLTKDLNEFRRLLLKEKMERFGMTWGVYDEAEGFLAKLSAADKVLKAKLGSSATNVELKPSDAPPAAATPGRAGQ
jgi:hypothetical protein